MRHALIRNGIVENVIIASQEFVNSLDFDEKILLTDSDRVELGYTYSGGVFTPPVVDMQKLVEDKILKAIVGFNKLVISYAATNVLGGITQLGKTKLISDTLSDVMRYGESGSLYQAIAALQAVVVTEEMAPFITAQKIESMIKDITELINSL